MQLIGREMRVGEDVSWRVSVGPGMKTHRPEIRRIGRNDGA